jgi:hypothetical protein
MNRYVPPFYIPPKRLMRSQYHRVFANTIDQVGPRDLSIYLDDYEKWTIRYLYYRVRKSYQDTRPTLSTARNAIEWDFQHGRAYSNAFNDTVGLFREHLPGIALQSQTVTAPELIESWKSPPSLRPPGYRLHEILPVVLAEDTMMLEEETPASTAVGSGVNFDDFAVPGWGESRVQWADGTTAQ